MSKDKSTETENEFIQGVFARAYGLGYAGGEQNEWHLNNCWETFKANNLPSTAPQEVQGEKDGWIRVEDDLPEFDKEVQVFGQRKQSSPKMNGNPPVITITSRQDLRKTALEKDASRYQDKNQFRLMENVTHWQPLPSPPKAM